MNKIFASKDLVKTSSMPGKTRLANLFLVNNKFYFTDLPGYGFAKHKGYGTAEHLHALSNLGPTCWHRKSFAPVTQWINAHPQA